MEFWDVNSVGSVRLKVFEPCSWSCEFCHNEWDLVASPIFWDEELWGNLEELRKNCGIKEVHLTGWEPTLNPQTPQIISGLKTSWFIAKVTTNGQFWTKIREGIAASGVDAVNFSLHTLVPEELMDIMSRKVSKVWAQEQIDRSQENIRFLIDAGVSVRINSVLSEEADIERIMHVFRFAVESWAEMRVLDNLNEKEASANGIQRLIELYSWELLCIKREPGTSSSRGTYLFPGIGKMIIKKIEKMFLDGVCQSCPHFNKDSCKEGFYNIRMQKRWNEWVVILCIQNKNEATVLSLKDFLAKYRK